MENPNVVLEIPEQVLMLRRGSRSLASTQSLTPAEQEKRAIVLKNDLLLHEAVIKCDADAVRKILKEPVDIDSRNNYGRAPIHWAASRGNLEIMELLISANCDIEAKDKYGMRPLLMAAWHGHKESVQMLVNAGALTNTVNKKQYSLLICAAHNNHLPIVNYILDDLEDVNLDATDVDGRTVLHHTAIGGHTQVARRLIEAGAEIDARDSEQRTPLHCACEYGHRHIVEFFLNESTTDMEANDSGANTPLHIAAEHQQTEIVQVLVQNGANPDAENNKGFTPLHVASTLGSRGILETLLQHGSCINKQSKNGSTPLHLACQANKVDIVELLISKGAELNCLNNRLQSPMHIAAELGYTDVCKVLLNAGANIEQREQNGKTPLYIAARGSFTAIVDMIIKTARLDYPTHEDECIEAKQRRSSLKPALKQVGRKVRVSSHDRVQLGRAGYEQNERVRQMLYKLAYKQLTNGEWKRLAHHWAFTDEQIKAIEHQYTGPASYKEHGFRMLLIWIHGLSSDVNPVKELCESLAAIDKRPIADALRKRIDQDNEDRDKGDKQNCCECTIT